MDKSNCKHQDWFNDIDKKLLEERNTARVKKLQLNTRSNRTKLTRTLKKCTREMKSQRWDAKEAEKKDMKEL